MLNKKKQSFEEWYTSNKNDTTYYNLRRTYELTPQKGEDHPTLKLYNSNSKNSKKFRQNYILDNSENYFKYLPIIK